MTQGRLSAATVVIAALVGGAVALLLMSALFTHRTATIVENQQRLMSDARQRREASQRAIERVRQRQERVDRERAEQERRSTASQAQQPFEAQPSPSEPEATSTRADVAKLFTPSETIELAAYKQGPGIESYIKAWDSSGKRTIALGKFYLTASRCGTQVYYTWGDFTLASYSIGDVGLGAFAHQEMFAKLPFVKFADLVPVDCYRDDQLVLRVELVLKEGRSLFATEKVYLPER